MKKFLAYGHGLLGQVCDTEDEARRAATGMDYELDSRTGYSSAFDCAPLSYGKVIEIDDRKITREEYMRCRKGKKLAEERLEREIEALKQRVLGPYEAIEAAYVNNGTDYGLGDDVRVTTRRHSGRKRVISGKVYGVHVVGSTGEIRPRIRNEDYPHDEPIISIEVLSRMDYKAVRQRVVCKNCRHYEELGMDHLCHTGRCRLKDCEVFYLHENEYDCYSHAGYDVDDKI